MVEIILNRPPPFTLLDVCAGNYNTFTSFKQI
jgi:hypothetical protein